MCRADAHPCAFTRRVLPAVVVGKSGPSWQRGLVRATYTGCWAAQSVAAPTCASENAWRRATHGNASLRPEHRGGP